MSIDAEALAREWEAKAQFWENQAARINRSRCHDGDRNLRIGMAQGARMCAAELRQAQKATGLDHERQQDAGE